jgi:hypothetical protein
MEEKNPDNPIGDAPGAISDTRGPEVEKRRRDYDQVVEQVAPTREYSFSFPYNLNWRKMLTPNLDANVDMSVVSSLPFPPLLLKCSSDIL